MHNLVDDDSFWSYSGGASTEPASTHNFVKGQLALQYYSSTDSQ